MGEMDCCNKSDQEMAIERLVEKRYKEVAGPFETDATERTLKDKIRREIKDMMLILKGD